MRDEQVVGTLAVPETIQIEMRRFCASVNNLAGEHNVEPIIERAHTLADAFMATSLGHEVTCEGVHTRATCSRGCDSCCHVKVELSALEAVYISEKVGVPVRLGKAGADAGQPCPFLTARECSIYAHRPLACRLFVSLDPPELCAGNDQYHRLFSAKSSPFWLWFLGWMTAQSEGLTLGVMEMDPFKDIRDWFAPNHP